MVPDHLRNVVGFAGLAASLVTLVTATPTLAQGITATNIMGAAPLAITLGAGAFALIAAAVVRRMLREGRTAHDKAAAQVATLRARVDEYEALLSGAREMVVLWSDGASGPRFLGQAAVLLPPGRRPEAVLDFGSWLVDADADAMARAIEGLRVNARSFELTLRTRDGRVVRAAGSLLGNGTALRLRPAIAPAPEVNAVPDPVPAPDRATARTVLGNLARPAFLRDAKGRLVFVNHA
jgi:PAS domain-containing protein